MNTATSIAIAKRVYDEKKMGKLEPGEYPIDETVTLRVRGMVVKDKDVVYTPTSKIPLKTTLALVLQRAGFQRDAIQTILVEAMNEALLAKQEGQEYVGEHLADIDAAMQRVTELTDKLTKAVRSGQTRCLVQIEEVQALKVE